MITSQRLKRSLLAVFAVLALVTVAPSAKAAVTLEGLAGWEGDGFGQGYGFVGAGAVKSVGARFALVTRLSASYLYYSFESSGIATSVTSPGVTAMTGVRTTLAWGSVAVLGGYETRWEDRRSDAGGEETSVTGGGVLQADADLGLGRRWRGFLSANYAGAARYLFSRIAVRWQATNLEWTYPVSFFVGGEGIGQGNDESAAAQSGPFLEWMIMPQRLSIAFHGGYKDSWSPGGPHRRGAYGGLSMYHRF
ncbi:MAG: cellulose biosynthesis protein BcsS [Nitrospirae bacterium]|nr:cellulose biosynthesis protein BcsS [Nitrospirota bacterium]